MWFLVGHATGTQNYICLFPGADPDWVLVGPQATLFNDADRQIVTHFLSPNPDEGGTARASWQHAQNTSAVWAKKVAESSDPACAAPGAIPCFRLQVVGVEYGPTGGQRLAETTFIQRVYTTGGMPPASGCGEAGQVGVRAFVPYTADYIFYKASGQE